MQKYKSKKTLMGFVNKYLNLWIVSLFIIIFLFSFSGISSADQPEAVWSFTADGPVGSGLAMDDTGVLYFGDHRGVFYALNSDGDLQWSLELGGDIKAKPVFGEQALYVTSNNGQLYALDYEGNQLWSQTISRDMKLGSPLILEDSVLVGGDFRVSAVSKEGSLLWSFNLGHYNYVNNEIDVDDKGTIYAGSNLGVLYALSIEGEERWSTQISQRSALNGPRLGEDVIYVGSDDGKFSAVDNEGEIIWTYDAFDRIMLTSPLLVEDRICFGTSRGLFCLDQEGNEVWSFNPQPGVYISTQLVAGEDGSVYFGSNDGRLFKVDEQGEAVKLIQVEGSISTNPVLDNHEKIIYFGTKTGTLYALEI